MVISAMSNGTGGQKFTDFIGNLNKDSVSLNIEVKDDDGTTIEKWEFQKPRLTSIDFGNASYDSDDIPLISLAFSVAAVEYE